MASGTRQQELQLASDMAGRLAQVVAAGGMVHADKDNPAFTDKLSMIKTSARISACLGAEIERLIDGPMSQEEFETRFGELKAVTPTEFRQAQEKPRMEQDMPIEDYTP